MSKSDFIKLIESLEIHKIENFEINYTDYETMNPNTKHIEWNN